jgi:spermidine synthase
MSSYKIYVIGALSSLFALLNRLSHVTGTTFTADRVSRSLFIFLLFLAALIGAYLFKVLNQIAIHYFYRVCFCEIEREKYKRISHYPFMSFLLGGLGFFGFLFPLKNILFMLLLFLLLQTVIFSLAMKEKNRNKLIYSNQSIFFLFIVSGFAALIYQVCWQRALFTVFGVNIESVTIIVSVFMFGLGIGSLLGGILAERFDKKLIEMFVLCEIVIGLFGVFSLFLIREFHLISINQSFVSLCFFVYLLLFLPTLFMGATLPILVTYLNKSLSHIGRSVSLLYFFNTLGSSLACFTTGYFLFKLFGLQKTVYLASFCNFCVAFFALMISKKLSKSFTSLRIQEKI